MNSLHLQPRQVLKQLAVHGETEKERRKAAKLLVARKNYGEEILRYYRPGGRWHSAIQAATNGYNWIQAGLNPDGTRCRRSAREIEYVILAAIVALGKDQNSCDGQPISMSRNGIGRALGMKPRIFERRVKVIVEDTLLSSWSSGEVETRWRGTGEHYQVYTVIRYRFRKLLSQGILENLGNGKYVVEWDRLLARVNTLLDWNANGWKRPSANGHGGKRKNAGSGGKRMNAGSGGKRMNAGRKPTQEQLASMPWGGIFYKPPHR